MAGEQEAVQRDFHGLTSYHSLASGTAKPTSFIQTTREHLHHSYITHATPTPTPPLLATFRSLPASSRLPPRPSSHDNVQHNHPLLRPAWTPLVSSDSYQTTSPNPSSVHWTNCSPSHPNSPPPHLPPSSPSSSLSSLSTSQSCHFGQPLDSSFD